MIALEVQIETFKKQIYLQKYFSHNYLIPKVDILFSSTVFSFALSIEYQNRPLKQNRKLNTTVKWAQRTNLWELAII